MRYVMLAVIMVCKGFGTIIAFPSTTILLTNSSTSLRVLGTLNGFATAFSGLGRGTGPLLAGLAFTWGVDRGYIIAPYTFLAVVSLIGAIPAFMIVEGDGPTAPPDDSESSDSDDMEESTATLLPDESAIEDDDDDSLTGGDNSPPLSGSK